MGVGMSGAFGGASAGGSRVRPGVSVASASGVAITFSSDWGTATGNSETAVRDGTTWGSRSVCTVPSTGLPATGVQEVVAGVNGWTRTPNVLRMRHSGVDGYCGQVVEEPVVPASTTHWGRMYFNSDLAGWTGMIHNFSYNFVGEIQGMFFRCPDSLHGNGCVLGFSIGARDDGVRWADTTDWHFQWGWIAKSTGGNPDDPADNNGHSDPNAILLPHNTWFRYEWQVEYVTAMTFRFYPRLYNMAGTLLYDASDFYVLWHGGSLTLQAWYDAGNVMGVLGLDPVNQERMRNIGIGNEGRVGGTEVFWYVADFAISTEGWIGDTP